MNPLTNVKNITKLNEIELSRGLTNKSSWHNEYKDSAWIFIGGLAYGITEGDVITVFSQYGEIVNINMVRDKKTGKTRGFCFLCYGNQKSTVLAVDNLNGIKLCNRTIRVDHVADYKLPKEHEDTDEITKKLYAEGCAPQPLKRSSSDDEQEVVEVPKKLKKPKKEKKKKKKKRKRMETDSSESDEKVSDKKLKIKTLSGTSSHLKNKSRQSASSSSDYDSDSPEVKSTKKNPEEKYTKHTHSSRTNNSDSSFSNYRTQNNDDRHHYSEKHNHREKYEQYKHHNFSRSSHDKYNDDRNEKKSYSSSNYRDFDKKKAGNYK